MLSRYQWGSQIISTMLPWVRSLRHGGNRLESFDIPLVCMLSSSRKGVLHALSHCLRMPLTNSPNRLEALIHFFPAKRAATLYPGEAVKEGGQ